MLKKLIIHKFSLLTDIHAEFKKGFTVVTGETGAGKSLIIGALKFLAGEKYTQNASGHTQAHISCTLGNCAREIILANLDDKQKSKIDINGKSFEISRKFDEKKSQAYICNIPISNKTLQSIMQNFLQIASQHSHLEFCKEKKQRHILDNFGSYPDNILSVKNLYKELKSVKKQIAKEQELLDSFEDPSYANSIVEELEKVYIESISLDSLHLEHQKHQNRQQLMLDIQASSDTLQGESETNIISLLHNITYKLESHAKIYPETSEPISMLQEAITLCQESSSQLQSLLEHDVSCDMETLNKLEQKLSKIHHLARKYKKNPQELPRYAAELREQKEQYKSIINNIELLQKKEKDIEEKYNKACLELSQERCTSAKKLSLHISKNLSSVGLLHGQFSILVQHCPGMDISQEGKDLIKFLFCANPGQILADLATSASGGELARISLLLHEAMPCDDTKLIIFDEADVGVSGATASLLGKMFSKIAKKNNVLCITHSPQVASFGEYHWHIHKKHSKLSTTISLEELSEKGHIEEIARLLSGAKITEQTIANAKDLCLNEN